MMAAIVDDWLNQVYDGDLAGFMSRATLVEVRYIICRAEDETMANADSYVEQSREEFEQDYEAKQDDLFGQ